MIDMINAFNIIKFIDTNFYHVHDDIYIYISTYMFVLCMKMMKKVPYIDDHNDIH